MFFFVYKKKRRDFDKTFVTKVDWSQILEFSMEFCMKKISKSLFMAHTVCDILLWIDNNQLNEIEAV